MWRICGRALVRMVKPVSVTPVAGRNLTQNLPKMPVPSLQRACEHYLNCLETIVDEDELKRTRELVEEFQKEGGVGERLQRQLESRAETADNWYTEEWEKFLFLSCRKPAMLHAGVGCVYPGINFTNKDGQIRGAAEIIRAALEFKTLVDNETLPVELMKGRPMCMDQYKRFWSSCRIPAPMTDGLEFYGKNPNPPTHISVVHNGQFFKLDVYNGDGTLLTVDQLFVQLQKICDSSPENNTEPVGILTAQNRDVWSETYSNLMQDETNKESVLAIQNSLFTLCLDRALPAVPDDQYTNNAAVQSLHGGGSQLNSGNRWFDKGLQFFVGETGTCGLFVQFAAVDGMVSAILSDYIIELLKRKKPDVLPSFTEHLPEPHKLQFNLTPELKEDIEEAKKHIDILAKEVFFNSSEIKQFGKDFVKTHKLDHHSFIQMAFQLAYYRMHKQIGVTMQPASLRYFRRGRLNVIFCNTPDSTAFIKAFDDPNKQNSEKMALLEKAMKTNRSNIKMAVNSQLIAGHLPVLMWFAMKEEVPLCDFFTDPNFTKAFDFKLVPSNITSRSGLQIFHAPTEPGSLEVLYDIQDDQTKVSVTTLKEDDSDVLLQATEDALVDLRTLLEQSS